VDRHDALAPALGVADADQAAAEVDVVAAEAEQLRAAQASVGEQREQQAVALWLTGVYALPYALAPGHLEQDVCGVALEIVALDAEAKETAQRRDRPWLACWRWAMGALLGQEAPQLGRVNLDQRADPSRAQEVKAGAHVALIRRARKVRETALDAAVDQEVRQGVEHRAVLSGGLRAPGLLTLSSLRLIDLLRKELANVGLSMWYAGHDESVGGASPPWRLMAPTTTRGPESDNGQRHERNDLEGPLRVQAVTATGHRPFGVGELMRGWGRVAAVCFPPSPLSDAAQERTPVRVPGRLTSKGSTRRPEVFLGGPRTGVSACH
jgi:hypothetical protein